MKIKQLIKPALLVVTTLGLSVAATAVFAQSASPSGGISAVATTVTSNLTGVAKLITAGSYVAGLGFAVGAILKFKAHKDNPQQIPVGTPTALVFIAAALLFLPSLMTTAGKTLFSSGGTTAGITGTDNFQNSSS